jgi:hypothetical protein
LRIGNVQSFQGQFENGIANGIATISFKPASTAALGSQATSNGNGFDCFEGVVRRGQMNGIGKVTYRDGTVLEGIFKDNKLSTPSPDAQSQSAASHPSSAQ